MSKHNKDYYKEIKGKQEPAILLDRICKECNSELGALHPDRVWCTNPECNYGELHIVGNGTINLKFKNSIK